MGKSRNFRGWPWLLAVAIAAASLAAVLNRGHVKSAQTVRSAEPEGHPQMAGGEPSETPEPREVFKSRLANAIPKLAQPAPEVVDRQDNEAERQPSEDRETIRELSREDLRAEMRKPE